MRLSVVCTLAWLITLTAVAAQERSPAALVLLLAAAMIALILLAGELPKPHQNRG